MNRKQILEYLSPTKTGPITVRQKLRYSISGLFKNDVSYSFFYECEEIGISWDSDGTILGGGFCEDVFTLFSQCKLDVESLKSKQCEYEEVPYDKKQLKYFLQSYSSKTFEVYFTDENWRRDYWFCKQANHLEFNIYMKDEERLLIQLSPAKIMMDLMMDNSPTKRTHLLAELPGKKGVYDYFTGSYVATRMLRTLSQYYGQFGFMFSDSIIEQIGDFVREGSDCTGEIHRKEETSADDEYSEEEEYSGYSEEEEYSRYSEDDKENASENKKLEYLSIFGLDEDAIWDDVVYARNAMLKMWHPDKWMNDERRKGIAEKQIKKINNAFDELKKIFESASEKKEEQQTSTDFEDYSTYFDYMNGENGKVKDEKKAFEFALKYAQNGYLPACYHVGLFYTVGLYGIPKDSKQAAFWLEKTAVYDNEMGASSAFYLGEIYSDSKENEFDMKKAIYWFKRSVDLGNPEAMNALGFWYLGGVGVEQNYQKAAELFRTAAEKGVIGAMCNIANCYKRGDGVEVDYEEARKWYEKAAMLGNAGAAYDLADLFRCYIADDSGDAFKWYKYGAEKFNHPDSYYNMGDYFNYGWNPVEENKEKAFLMYKKALDLGCEDARSSVGEMLLRGNGVEKSEKEALRVLQPLIDERDSYICSILGEFYEEENEDKKALPYLNIVIENEKGEENGHTERAVNSLARIHLKKGTRDGLDKAYQLLLKINYWSPDANKMLIEIYNRPDWGSYYLEQSIHYFLKEIVTEKMAYPRLAECYIIAQQYTLALSVAEECDKIVEKPDSDVHYKHENYSILGICYLNGFGCTPDFDKAFNYFFMNDLEYWNWDEDTDAENYQELNEYHLLAKAYCEYYGKGTVKDASKAMRTLKEAYEFEDDLSEYAGMLLDYLNNHYS